MKKIPPILLGLLPYILAVLGAWWLLIEPEQSDGGIWDWLVYAVLGLILIVNIGNAVILCRRREDFRSVALWNLLIKLVHIPFYAFVFFGGVAVGFLGLIPVPFMVFISMGIVVFLVLVDCAVLWSSSVYGITAVRLGRKEGVLSRREAVGYSVLHFIFCLDVIAAILLYIKARQGNRAMADQRVPEGLEE